MHFWGVLFFAISILTFSSQEAFCHGYGRDTFSIDDQIDSIISDSSCQCWEAGNKYPNLFRAYYLKGRPDSAAVLLARIDEKCSPRVVALESRLATFLVTQETEAVPHQSLFPKAAGLQHRFQMLDIRCDTIADTCRTDYWEHMLFMRNLGDSLARASDTSSTRHVLGLFLAGRFKRCFSLLNNQSLYSGTPTRKAFENALNSLNSHLWGMVTVFPGVWIPTGKAGVLGPKADIGLFCQARLWRIFADIAFAFRVGNTTEPYTITVNDTTYPGGWENSGLDIGIGLGYEVVRFGWHQLDIMFRIGYDFFSPLKSPRNESIFSTYFGPGIGYQYYVGRNRTLVINPRIFYQFVDYPSDPNVLNTLKGNCVRIQLIFGLSDHAPQHERHINLKAEKRLMDIRSKRN